MPGQHRLFDATSLSQALAAFAFVRAEEIILSYASLDARSLRRRDVTPQTVHEDLVRFLSTDQRKPLLKAVKRHRDAYLECFCYVMFWTDYLFQARKDGAHYLLLVRPDLQRLALTLAAGVAGTEPQALEDLLVNRVQEYTFNPTQNNISLCAHVTGRIPGEPLIFAMAAYAYALAAFGVCMGPIVLGDVRTRLTRRSTAWHAASAPRCR